MKPERRFLGLLGALLCVLPTAPLAWWLTRSDVFVGLAGLVGFLLAVGGYRVLAGHSSGFGVGVSALLTFPAALPGIWYGYAELILRENEPFGCTMQEALDLVPTVVFDPYNRFQVLWDLGSVLALDLLAAFLYVYYRRSK
jgi:hypothetical protein